MTMIGIIAIFVGIIFMIAYPINKKKNTRCSAETEGELVDIIQRYDSQGSLKSAHVYSYEVDGAEYQLQTTDHSLQANNIGDKCTIWYNPSKPKDAQAFRGTDNYLKTLLIIGIVLIPLGIIMCII